MYSDANWAETPSRRSTSKYCASIWSFGRERTKMLWQDIMHK